MITGYIILIKRFRLSAKAKNKVQELWHDLIKRAESFKHFKSDCHSAPRVESIEDAVVIGQLDARYISPYNSRSVEGLEQEYKLTEVSCCLVVTPSVATLLDCIELGAGSSTLKVFRISLSDEMLVDKSFFCLVPSSFSVDAECSKLRMWRSEDTYMASKTATRQSSLFFTKSDDEAFSSSKWKN